MVTLFAFSKPLGQPLAGNRIALFQLDLEKVAGAGFEHPPQNGANSISQNESGAECGAPDAREAAFDPRLSEVVDGWGALPEVVKVGVLAMVRSAR